MPEIHYLSATAVVAPDAPDGRAHLAFCGQQMIYGHDSARYQVANYGDPWRVTCKPCIAEWSRIYPAEHEQFLRRYPRPEVWNAPADEHPDITEVREYHAGYVRRWLSIYVRDESVATQDLMAALAHMTERHARERAALALNIHNEGK